MNSKPHQSESSEEEETKTPTLQKEKGQRGKPPRPLRRKKEEILSDLRRLPYEEVEWVLSHFPICRPLQGGLPPMEVPLPSSIGASSTPERVEVPKRAGRTDLPARSASSAKRTAKAKERKLKKQLKDGGAGLSQEVREGLEKKIAEARQKREREKAKLSASPTKGTSTPSSSSSSSNSSSESARPPLTVPASPPPAPSAPPPPTPPSPSLHPSSVETEKEKKKREKAEKEAEEKKRKEEKKH